MTTELQRELAHLRARHGDPATSHEAARRAASLAGEHEAAILRVLRAAAEPLTAHEIAARCDLAPVQVSRRLGHLRDNGVLVVDGGGQAPSGCRAQRWRIA